MNSKRNTLKGLVGLTVITTALPSKWSKPIVKGIVLPAHAQTSTQFQATVRFFTNSSFSTEIPNGSTIAIGSPYVVLINVIPEPGQPVGLMLTTSINGIPNPPATGTTNSEGALAFAVPAAGNNDPANVGLSETFVEIGFLPTNADPTFSGSFSFTDAFFLAFTLG